MKKILSTALGMVLVAGTAMAVPITGGLSFTGEVSYLGPDSPTTLTATGVHFENAATGTGTGSFGPVTKYSAATFHDITNFTAPGVVNPLWSVTDAGVTYSFDLLTGTKNAFTIGGSNFLLLTGTGTFDISGGPGTPDYETTKGYWSFSTQNPTQGGSFTFSASSTTNSPVPEPATMVLLGTGLLGVAGMTRRLKK